MSGFDRFEKQIAEGHAESALRDKSVAQHGTRGGYSTFYRYVIIDSIFDPTIVDDAKVAYWEHTLGVTNIKFAKVLPKNTVIAQRVLEGTASATEKPMFLFPFFPPALSLPCNPGEHVWVMFEDKINKQADLGFWMSRIVGPGFVDDVNHTHMPRAMDGSYSPGTKDTFEGNDKPRYGFNLGRVVEDGGVVTSTVETSTVATEDERFYEKLMTESDAGSMRTYEAVPRFRKRPGDVSLEGSNNTLISMGQHRTGAVASYEDDDEKGKIPSLPETDIPGGGNGSIDIVVGRGQTDRTLGRVVTNSLQRAEVAKTTRETTLEEGDPDIDSDRSRVMLTQRSQVDIDLGLDGFNGTLGVSDGPDGDGAVVIKTDKVRLIARSDIELLVSGFTRDGRGRMVSSDKPGSYAAIIIKADGNIIMKPADSGYLFLGGEDADKALVCTDAPAIAANGQVTAAPLITTMGGQFAATGVAGQGKYASKILVKG